MGIHLLNHRLAHAPMIVTCESHARAPIRGLTERDRGLLLIQRILARWDRILARRASSGVELHYLLMRERMMKRNLRNSDVETRKDCIYISPNVSDKIIYRNLLVPAAAATAKSVTTFNLDKRESAAEMDSTGECTTASGSISASPALSPQPVSTEITKSEDRKRINVFTDPLNWVDTEAIFAWTVTIVNALTKEKEQLSVYNNNTVGEVKKSFIENTGCSTGMRLFHLVGMKCQELEDDWELRHCIRNRANVIAYAGDLPALLQGAGALKSDQTESEQPKAQQTVVVGKS
mmetsp:Transcript_10952/g.17541  ORF Transcript_10952/g.17541 Transcript_10952/m.17541 type:complete len:291 (+) Transcript_10952:420-1292(+)